MFRKARAVSPSIVFFDEIDALASERGRYVLNGTCVLFVWLQAVEKTSWVQNGKMLKDGRNNDEHSSFPHHKHAFPPTHFLGNLFTTATVQCLLF